MALHCDNLSNWSGLSMYFDRKINPFLANILKSEPLKVCTDFVNVLLYFSTFGEWGSHNNLISDWGLMYNYRIKDFQIRNIFYWVE